MTTWRTFWVIIRIRLTFSVFRSTSLSVFTHISISIECTFLFSPTNSLISHRQVINMLATWITLNAGTMMKLWLVWEIYLMRTLPSIVLWFALASIAQTSELLWMCSLNLIDRYSLTPPNKNKYRIIIAVACFMRAWTGVRLEIPTVSLWEIHFIQSYVIRVDSTIAFINRIAVRVTVNEN